MQSDIAKVLHQAAGRSLLDWSLSALGDLPLRSIAIVVGHQAAAVSASIAAHELAPLVTTALQSEQLGTGHATLVGLSALMVEPDDTVVAMPGDMPLLKATTLAAFAAHHDASQARASVATSIMDDPTGYGRVKRAGDRVVGIVEEADATTEERAIREVNTSVYAFSAGPLAGLLGRLETTNAQGELYLTDAVAMLAAADEKVTSFPVDLEEAMGVNTLEQLAAAAAALERRHNVG
jgi:bifunctional UDP-N-acetylglucosamine pyrophosphorylase/glucosamine-1-phosphate N-acetyltransferase